MSIAGRRFLRFFAPRHGDCESHPTGPERDVRRRTLLRFGCGAPDRRAVGTLIRFRNRNRARTAFGRNVGGPISRIGDRDTENPVGDSQTWNGPARAARRHPATTMAVAGRASKRRWGLAGGRYFAEFRVVRACEPPGSTEFSHTMVENAGTRWNSVDFAKSRRGASGPAARRERRRDDFGHRA